MNKESHDKVMGIMALQLLVLVAIVIITPNMNMLQALAVGFGIMIYGRLAVAIERLEGKDGDD